MVCDVVEIASGVGVTWARRDGAGVVVAAMVPGVAAVPLALSVLTALVPVDVAVPSSAVSAVAFVMAPSSACLCRCSWCRIAPAARRFLEAESPPQWLPWATSRRPWSCKRSRRADSKGVVS